MGLRKKHFNIMRVHLKTLFLGVGGGGGGGGAVEVTQNQYIGRRELIKGVAWIVCRFKGTWQKKRGSVFEGG